MSHDEPPMMGRWERLLFSYMLWIWLSPLIVFLVVLTLYYALRYSSPPTTKRVSGPAQTNESKVETARQGLSRQTDLNACRAALQQINAELGEKASLRPPSLTKEQKDWLRDNLQLNNEEMSEVESSHYSRLDNHHLFRCFLMRDAANALEVKGVRKQAAGPAVREKPLDQAMRAFAWVMREVRLHPEEGEASPPSFVLRRGWGSALERSLIFLALLEQLGEPDAPQPEMLGLLLDVPDGRGGMNLWACGVVVGDGKDVYLFDPNLGLPLPGPNGEGVATLAQAREKTEILAQLNVDAKNRYLLTKEQVQAAQAQLVCPLSALSPRMRYLQEKLLAPAVRVRLARDAAKDMERVKTACSTGAAKPIPVQVAKDKCTLLRRFLPVDEGGADANSREQLFQLALVPWNTLPSVFQDERIFSRRSEMGKRALTVFAASFITPTMEPDYARDLMLRGRYGSAVEKLLSERSNWRSALEQRANAENLQEQFQAWVDEATRNYASLVRAKSPQEREQAEKQVTKLWEGRSSVPVRIVLNSAAAAVRNPAVEYQLGLCSQEQAEQMQARLDLQARVGVTLHTPDVEKAQSAWQNAVENWKRFEEDYPKRPDVKHPELFAARRLRGRGEAMLGEHKAAIASWKNVANAPSDLERLACLYLAQQWEKKHSGNTN
jgi:hypothetical protein